MGFDEEFKWCTNCKRYVKYLQNSDSSFCVHCGEEVILLSEEDWEKFQTTISYDNKSSKRGQRSKACREME